MKLFKEKLTLRDALEIMLYDQEQRIKINEVPSPKTICTSKLADYINIEGLHLNTEGDQDIVNKIWQKIVFKYHWANFVWTSDSDTDVDISVRIAERIIEIFEKIESTFEKYSKLIKIQENPNLKDAFLGKITNKNKSIYRDRPQLSPATEEKYASSLNENNIETTDYQRLVNNFLSSREYLNSVYTEWLKEFTDLFIL